VVTNRNGHIVFRREFRADQRGCVFSTGVYISSFKVEPVRIGRVRMFLGVSGTADDD
jgi:hypothetical protein